MNANTSNIDRLTNSIANCVDTFIEWGCPDDMVILVNNHDEPDCNAHLAALPCEEPLGSISLDPFDFVSGSEIDYEQIHSYVCDVISPDTITPIEAEQRWYDW